ncbi:hypothetical protein ACFYZ8_06605 [Streptomyces sp. NPDC001668]|uniref:hypothetical protein n=1 Tax=unclassified Streptomyces TaxID=2593676 RepID=UPI003406BEB9
MSGRATAVSGTGDVGVADRATCARTEADGSCVRDPRTDANVPGDTNGVHDVFQWRSS